ncbi:MAG TPA: acyl-CoA dehydrogenase family protein [Streptosporangiaceae bacterium]
MDTPEQAALRAALRDLLGRGLGAGAPAGTLWKRMTGELGLTGLAVPESHGGAGAGLAEIAVAVSETGRVLAPVPYLSTALAGYVLGYGEADAGDAGAPGEFLRGIADGSVRAAFAFAGPVIPAGALTVCGGRVSGVASNVLDGACADLFVVACDDSLWVVWAGDARVTPAGTLDQTRPQATAEFSSAEAVPVTGVSAAMAADLFRVLLAVESAGAAAHCLDVTVEYLRTRSQFGRALGTFQALRHRCADLAVEVASATATASAAVAGAADPGVLGPLAKKYCADVFWHVAAEMIQLHGGIGCTWEHEAHRYLKRAKTTQLVLGSPAELRRLVAARAGLF